MIGRNHNLCRWTGLIAAAVALLVVTPQAIAGERQVECEAHEDCPGTDRCIAGACVSEGHRAYILGQSTQEQKDASADELCGADRRCRIRRLAHRNQMRRHYQAAEQQKAIYDRVNSLLEKEQEQIARRREPSSTGLQYHPWGFGFVASHTFDGHFRADVSLVYDGRYINYSPDRDDLSNISGSHSVWTGAGHATYLPSRAWFSPLVSVGFGIGNGEFSGGNRPGVIYHFVTAAVGVEAQFDSGMVVRMAYRHGLLAYNQARYGPGDYDDNIRESLREYMHDQGLSGFDFSLGWAF